MTDRRNPQSLKRRRAEKAGRRAEWIAAVFLLLKGYRLLSRRYRAPSGEVDLIAAKGDVIAFVEVKARPELDMAISAVSYHARRRIERAADLFIAANPHLAERAMRYDIVAMAGWRIRHLRAAWRHGE